MRSQIWRYAFKGKKRWCDRIGWRLTAFGCEAVLLLGSTLASIVSVPSDATRLYAVIVLTGLAMGLRNATVRKIAQPEFDYHGLDTDDYWAGSRLFFCGRQQSTMAETSNFHSPDVRWSVRGCSATETLAGLAIGGGNSLYCLWHGNPRLESGETPISGISGKVRKDEHLAYLEQSPARDRAMEVSSPLGD